MAEKSYLWTTGVSGDGLATYTQNDWTRVFRIMAAVFDEEGVAPNYFNQYNATIPALNTVRIDTGAAVVDGKPHDSDTTVDINIPSASGGGNTRIDRVCLRANWSARTVRLTRIAGTDAASPTPPALTQSPGSTYDLPLFQVRVNTSGTVTIELDERVFGRLQSNGIADSAVATAKLANAAVTLAKLAANSVDDTIAGDRVPQLYRRQGYDANSWAASGTGAPSNYTPGPVRIQVGSIGWQGVGVFSVAVTFPVAFSQPPIVLATINAAGAFAYVTNVTATGFTFASNADGATGRFGFWIAIGPE